MRRIAGKDAIFLYMDTPTNPMHMAFAGVLDPTTVPGGGSGLDLYLRLVDGLRSRLHLFPPFRQRLVTVPFQLHHPLFIEDPTFDLEYHVRRAALPAPGGQRELEEFVSDVMSRPMDRSHPLWEMYVVEGVEGGRCAIVAKAHHVIVDGIGGNEILVNLVDLSPEPREVEPPEREWQPDDVPSDARLLAGAVVANLAQPPRLVRTVTRTAGKLVQVARERVAGDSELPFATLGPRTVLNASVSAQRRVAFGAVPLEDVKRVKRVLDCKVNDVVLAMCGRALHRFLAAMGDEPDSQLVAAVPISIRDGDGEDAGNRVAGMTVPLADDEADPVEQLRRIAESTADAKDAHGAITADLMMDWTEFATPALAAQAFRFYSGFQVARRHRPVANVTISNVPGPDFPLYIAGAQLESMYPIGPVVHGQALNVTIVSYRGRMFIGVVADRGAVPDVAPLVTEMGKALGELLEAADAAEGSA